MKTAEAGGETDQEKRAESGQKMAGRVRKSTGQVGNKDGGSSERTNKWEMVEVILLSPAWLTPHTLLFFFSFFLSAHTHLHTPWDQYS